MIGISKSGFGAGLGSLAVPLIAFAVPVPQAAAILMPVLLVMDLFGLAALRKDYDRALLRFLLPFGLLGVVIGALMFKVLDAHIVAGIVGAFTLIFLAQRLLFPPHADAPPPSRWIGGVLTTASGFTSFAAHAGSPPITAYVIPLKLQPIVFAATLSYFFFFINLAKWIPYAWLGLLDVRNFLTSLVLVPLVPVGVWVGVNVARRISQKVFYRLLYAGMFLTGCKLLLDGFAG
jgi:uncharacterized membrane protein YfcA